MNKIIYIDKSLKQLTLSIKAFDIYIFNTIKQHCKKYNNNINKKIKYHTLYTYMYINNIYIIYNDLCLNEFQYITFKILQDYCNNFESHINSQYISRFKYILNKHLFNNYYNYKKDYKLSYTQLAIINTYILNQTQDKYGFYILIKYLLIL
nr:hypothetical protein [Calliblepharis sp.]